MRLSLWLFVCLIYLQFPTYSFGNGNTQADEKITLSGTFTLHIIFQRIEKQVSKHIYYTNTILNDEEKFAVNLIDASLQQVLSQILSNKNLEWSIEKNFISIRKIKNKIESSSVRPDTTISVSGRVINEKGEPIVGATILVKGTKKGTTSSTNGFFQLDNISQDASLLISSVVYLPQEIRIMRKANLHDIQLKENISKLDETIIIAYGTTSRRLSTGNVSTVKAMDIEKQPVSNPLLALQGRVAGLFITQATGYSGSGVKVRIQGQNSINNGNDPLYVVDGVPFTSQLLPTLNLITGNSGTANDQNLRPLSGNPLNYINPNDIESIDILKDADATAIYGSRAANGAILITTKKGKPGKTNIDVNIQTGWGKVASKLKLLNNKQYLEMRHEALTNDGLNADPDADYDLFNRFGWDTTRSTDWQKVLIGRVAYYNNLQFSISGGNENVQYHLGSTYKRETAVVPGNFEDNKGAFHFNTTATSLNKKFKVFLTGNYLIDKNKLPTVDLTYKAINISPVAPKLNNPDGSLNWALNENGTSTWGVGNNPVAELNNSYTNTTNNLTSNFTLGYSILTGLEIKSSFGYNKLMSDEIFTSPTTSLSPEEQPSAKGASIFNNSSSSSWIIEPQLAFKRSFGNLKFDALIGGTIQENNNKSVSLIGLGYSNNEVLGDLSNAGQISLNYSTTTEYRYNAFFTRFNFNLRNQFILNISGRRDGSSRFGSENLHHIFGSIGGAWIFSMTEFIRQHMPFLSFGKLRASYGTTGSDQISDYKFLNLYTPTFRLPYDGIPGMVPANFSNPYLQWEETKKMQFGLDIGVFHERLFFAANYYQNKSSNQLLQYNLPVMTGFSSITANFPATVKNSGLELTLNTSNIDSKDFNWSTNINLTFPKNELAQFSGLETSSYGTLLVIGQPLSIVKAFNFVGVDPATGLYQFLDLDGKLTSEPNNTIDKYRLINTDQKFYGGFQNTFSYKSLSLDILFQFVKQTGINYRFGNFPGVWDGNSGNQPISVLDRWKTPGDVASGQRFNTDFSLLTSYLSAVASDAVYSDASYARLKNLSLSWKFPQDWTSKIGMTNSQLFIHGQNLLTITNYAGLDPETRSSNTLPPLKMLTVGFKATF